MVKNLPAMPETQVQSLGQEVPQEKEMATHSSIIAWRIPWTEEPGGLLFMGLQRVRHDRVTNTFTFSPGLVLGVRNDESHSQRQFYKQIMPRGPQALCSRPLLQKWFFKHHLGIEIMLLLIIIHTAQHCAMIKWDITCVKKERKKERKKKLSMSQMSQIAFWWCYLNCKWSSVLEPNLQYLQGLPVYSVKGLDICSLMKPSPWSSSEEELALLLRAPVSSGLLGPSEFKAWFCCLLRSILDTWQGSWVTSLQSVLLTNACIDTYTTTTRASALLHLVWFLQTEFFLIIGTNWGHHRASSRVSWLHSAGTTVRIYPMYKGKGEIPARW